LAPLVRRKSFQFRQLPNSWPDFLAGRSIIPGTAPTATRFKRAVQGPPDRAHRHRPKVSKRKGDLRSSDRRGPETHAEPPSAGVLDSSRKSPCGQCLRPSRRASCWGLRSRFSNSGPLRSATSSGGRMPSRLQSLLEPRSVNAVTKLLAGNELHEPGWPVFVQHNPDFSNSGGCRIALDRLESSPAVAAVRNQHADFPGRLPQPGVHF
jgi:hypothetical protein